MRTPINWPLLGDRGLAFSDTLPIVGIDFTGAAYRSQVRLAPDAPGSAVATLTVSLIYGGTATVAAHIAAGRLSAAIYSVTNGLTGAKYISTDNVAMSEIELSLSSGAMAAMPPAPDEGDAALLAWDLLITPSGGTEDKWVYGTFTVRGTVTQ